MTAVAVSPVQCTAVQPGKNIAAGDAQQAATDLIKDLIQPPADLRGVIEKTAQFVAKNGVEFEQRVMRDQNNQKFSFLFQNNPYHAFYQLKVREYRTGQEAPKPQVPQAIQDMRKREEEGRAKKQQLLMLTQVSDGELSHQKVEPPEPDVYSVLQPYVAMIDIDIIQTTAQFVARNGQRFLAGLAQREKQNPQFEFLKPSHPLFNYFTNLVDAYTRCLLPPKEQLEKLQELSGTFVACLQRILKRYRYESDQERKRRERENKSTEERAAMLCLDWQEFHIVETIEFTEEDETLPLAAPVDFTAARELPKPILVEEETGDDSIASLIEKAAIGGQEDEMETEDEIEVDAVVIPDQPSKKGTLESATQESGDVVEESLFEPVTSLDAKPALKIIKGYVRHRKRAGVGGDVLQGMQKCPITGQLVPATEMSNHLRILLLDPKWKEQKERFLAKARQESAFALMEDVESNLASFVAKRPDLFGSVEDQVVLEDGVVRAVGTDSGVSVPSTNASYDPSAVPSGSGSSIQVKRPRTDPTSPDLNNVTFQGVEITIQCIPGAGLEAQEIQVEVDPGMTIYALKESLLEAGLGTDGVQALNVVLKNSPSGAVMSNDKTLAYYGVKSRSTRFLFGITQ